MNLQASWGDSESIHLVELGCNLLSIPVNPIRITWDVPGTRFSFHICWSLKPALEILMRTFCCFGFIFCEEMKEELFFSCFHSNFLLFHAAVLMGGCSGPDKPPPMWTFSFRTFYWSVNIENVFVQQRSHTWFQLHLTGACSCSPSLSEDVIMSVGTHESRSASMMPRGSNWATWCPRIYRKWEQNPPRNRRRRRRQMREEKSRKQDAANSQEEGWD